MLVGCTHPTGGSRGRNPDEQRLSFAEIVLDIPLVRQPLARFLVVSGFFGSPGSQPVHVAIEHAERRRDQDRVVNRLVIRAAARATSTSAA